MTESEQHLREIQREYLDFLDDEADQGTYTFLVKKMISENGNRLLVNINDIRQKNPNRAECLLNNAFEEQFAFSEALKELVSFIQPNYGHDKFYVAFEGCFGKNHVTPRQLTVEYLGKVVCVEGIVVNVSIVRPKIVTSVHFCPATNKSVKRKYTDAFSFEGIPNNVVYPIKDNDGNLMEAEYGLSVYKDCQTLSLQEMPEKTPAGELPQTVNVIFEDDLVDRCKPGDRVQIVGHYRCLPSKYSVYTSGVFKTVLVANYFFQLNEGTSVVSREDVRVCRQLLAQHNDIFDLLSKSLAPSIYGQYYVKRAILCLLLGGVEKNLPNGTRLRGDINVLLIGDPSVGKSQFLRYVLNIAPRAITTTGRGSSGVGLTAAVATDQETGERHLEAGAMVLADRGVVCIDEFDKMTVIDRTAIHEVMEQGRVSISKAGIHATLNARCSVLAAANPVYGRYDAYKTPMENIGMQDSLLSRFDLVFVMSDIVDNEDDERIADHVIRMQCYDPTEQGGTSGDNPVHMLTTFNPESENKETPIFAKYDRLLHGSSRKPTDQILSFEFLKKYISIAKCIKPKLTEHTCKMIEDEYCRLRLQNSTDFDEARIQPITARTLETLIRLSTAYAKARMSKTVEAQDAQAAIELIQYASFKRVLCKNADSDSQPTQTH